MNSSVKSKGRLYMLNLIKSIIAILFIIVVLIFIDSCKKHTDGQTTPVIHNFTGIVEIDETGMPIGSWGVEDGDWKTDSCWSEEEYHLLNFPDTVSLDNTFIEDTIGWNAGTGIHEQPKNMVIAYPNPVSNRLTICYSGFGLLKFKVAIVDKYFNTVFTYASKNDTPIQLDISDPTIFQDGSIYRMYYSLSVKDSVNFYKGHGDILICRKSESQECKKFVP